MCHPTEEAKASEKEAKQIRDLSRAGKRLIGFCRTNLFKRLESSGSAFIQSVERHVLRNCVFLHALRHHLPLPVGSQEAVLLDAALPHTRFTDDEDRDPQGAIPLGDDERLPPDSWEMDVLIERAAAVYRTYRKQRFRNRFKWLRPKLFLPLLGSGLEADTEALLSDSSRQRSMGRGPRREAGRPPRSADRGPSRSEDPRLLPVRRHRRLPGAPPQGERGG